MRLFLISALFFTSPLFAANALLGQAPSSLKSKFSGNIRYRVEQVSETSLDTYKQNRIQARLRYDSPINKTADATLRIATGNTSITSTNVNLGNGGINKAIALDVAQVAWRAPFLKANFGKLLNPFHRPGGSDLVWDLDYTPEGVALVKEGKNYFLVAGEFILNNSTTAAPDGSTQRVQLGYNYHLNNNNKVVLSVGYISHNNLRELINTGNSNGNSVTLLGGSTFYTHDFNIVHTTLEWRTHLKSMILSLYYDMVKNNSPQSDNKASLGGFSIGHASKTWTFKMNYKHIEKDALLGALADGDFRGGGTDGSGLITKFIAKVFENTSATFTLLQSRKGLQNSIDFNKFQVDLGFQF